MTIQELLRSVRKGKRSWQDAEATRVFVYDPTREDYIEATGIAFRPDGGIDLQTPD